MVLPVALLGCPPAPPAIDTGWGVADPVWADVEPIVADACVRCHHPDTRLAGGVDYSTARAVHSGRIGLVCTSVGEQVIDAFAASLSPIYDPSLPACHGFEPLSMPHGAQPRLSIDDQVTLARWVAIGAPEN